MPRIEFLGVGDATDFELGQTSAVYDGGCRLLIDCGPQIPQVLTRRLVGADDLDAVFLTHTHADHCFGLASLLLWMRQQGRKRPLAMIAEASVLLGIRQLVELGYPGAFEPSKCFAIEACPLSTIEPFVYGSTMLRIAPTDHDRPNFALRIDDGGAACAFSGDGRPVAQTADLYAGVQLLVHECAFLERVSQSHMNVRGLVELYRAARPRRLAVVHCAREQRAAIESTLAAELGDAVVFPRAGQGYDLAVT